MKKLTNRATTLVAENLAYALAVQEDQRGNSLAAAALAMLGDMCDSIIKGEVSYISLGLNMKKTSLLLTVNGADGEKQYVPGLDMADLIYQTLSQVSDERAAALYDATPF